MKAELLKAELHLEQTQHETFYECNCKTGHKSYKATEFASAAFLQHRCC